ncbi:hypothetical protein [Lysinibacillus sp. TE18511]
MRESEAATADVVCVKAQCQRSVSSNNMMLVTQSLPQDVVVLRLSSYISADVCTLGVRSCNRIHVMNG